MYKSHVQHAYQSSASTPAVLAVCQAETLTRATAGYEGCCCEASQQGHPVALLMRFVSKDDGLNSLTLPEKQDSCANAMHSMPIKTAESTPAFPPVCQAENQNQATAEREGCCCEASQQDHPAALLEPPAGALLSFEPQTPRCGTWEGLCQTALLPAAKIVAETSQLVQLDIQAAEAPS